MQIRIQNSETDKKLRLFVLISFGIFILLELYLLFSFLREDQINLKQFNFVGFFFLLTCYCFYQIWFKTSVFVEITEDGVSLENGWMKVSRIFIPLNEVKEVCFKRMLINIKTSRGNYSFFYHPNAKTEMDFTLPAGMGRKANIITEAFKYIKGSKELIVNDRLVSFCENQSVVKVQWYAIIFLFLAFGIIAFYNRFSNIYLNLLLLQVLVFLPASIDELMKKRLIEFRLDDNGIRMIQGTHGSIQMYSLEQIIEIVPRHSKKGWEHADIVVKGMGRSRKIRVMFMQNTYTNGSIVHSDREDTIRIFNKLKRKS